jgi:cytochrome c oxidase assembly factor CtaG
MSVLAHVGSGTYAPLELAAPLALALAYLWRARTLARRGRPVPWPRQAAFVGGIAVILASLVSPVAHLGEELLVAHMVQHLLMADVGALLIVLGLTGPMLAPLLRRPGVARLSVLAHPLVAFPLWLANLYLWHLPAAYQATLSSEAVHALMHGLFIGLGALVWLPLFGPLPRPQWFGTAGRLVYIVAVRLGGAVLANVLLWTEAILYPAYAPGRALWDLSALSDQGVAGAVMMVEESVLTLALFGWLFLRWAAEQEEEQDLIELARRRGLELDPARARRAVVAGRGEELRARLTGESPSRAEAVAAGGAQATR